MSFNPVVAIRLTPLYAHLTGWPDSLGKVFGVLGFTTRNPTAGEFVAAVRAWQLARPPLDADGMLGAETWKKLQPEVRAYRGRVAVGTRPDWVDLPAPVPARASAAAPHRPPSPPATADAPEDRAIGGLVEAWRGIGDRRTGDPHLASPAGTAHTAGDVRPRLSALATAGICGTLRVGQVWQGLSGGDRIVVALNAAGTRPGTGTIDFVTDSGQVYRQSPEGWNADFLAGVYAGVIRTMAPVHTLLESEAEVLLGAIAATGGVGFATGTGTGPTHWVLRNRTEIAALVGAVPPVVGAIFGLREHAPVTFDKVIRAVFRRVLAEVPEAAAGNPRFLVRFVGVVLVKLGGLALKRDAKALADAIAPLSKCLVRAVGRVVAADLTRDLRRSGVALTPDDADRILGEIGEYPQEIKKRIDQLQPALLALS